MQDTYSKVIISFLLALVTNVAVIKSETSFLEVQYSCLNNSPFYYNYNIKFCLNYLPCRSNNFNYDYCFFSC